MKKILFILLPVIVIALAGIYILIPETIRVSKVVHLACTEKGAERIIYAQPLWKEWWPAAMSNDSSYDYNGCNFKVNRRIADDIEIIIQHQDDSLSSLVKVISIDRDSSIFSWKCQVDAGNNPVSRVRGYFRAATLKENMDELTEKLAGFLADKEHIYGIGISQTKITDTFIITYKNTLRNYPSTVEIYGYIKSLQDYIKLKEAEQTDPPLLHIEQTDSSLYDCMVAIPVNKIIPNSGNYVFKRMPRGNMLISSDITGGIGNVNKALGSVVNYVNDYQRISPGISFISFVTDRTAEPDSSKWISRIYYPVF